MKKLKILFLIFVLMCLSVVTAQAMTLSYDDELHEYDGSIYALIVNNELLEPPLAPIIFNDHALVPVREIFEELGAEVSYDSNSQAIEIEKNDDNIRMYINNNVAYVNGNMTHIPDGVVPKLISELGGETKTMVPVRFISESIGLNVEFDSEHEAILVESDEFEFDDGWSYTYNSHANALVTDVSCKKEANNRLNITMTASKTVGDIDKFLMENPNRIVVDIYNAVYYGLDDFININMQGIDAIRLGDNGERARIVIEYSDLSNFTVEKKSDNVVSIIIETNQESYPSTVTPDASKLIVLDAGHGGTDSGAVGYLNGNQVLEKNLTLEITYKVKERLEERGYSVLMTRTGDTLPSLTERPEMANAANAAVFVSIHINSVDNVPTANGTEVFYSEENNGYAYGVNSKTLADNILTRMLYYMNSTNRGVKMANHAVTRRSNMPASLVEIGFITNDTELYNMTSDEYQYKAAQGIAEGIMITLENVNVP
ncbi:MAG: N-acetylmuramoyl-L-alanine amidase family protein [Clostridia bacterium]|nr:N-acetylmuramoyl-L-alanine amidase family protein [Clostridia bacterium]